ncbi:thioredoxin family protein [Sinobacterium caligoides]|nr:thioredoxin family protein [Sinobacterium caligoides]
MELSSTELSSMTSLKEQTTRRYGQPRMKTRLQPLAPRLQALPRFKLLLQSLVVSVLFTLAVASVAAAPPARVLPDYSQSYSAERDPFVDAVAAIKLASDSGRQVFIEVGGSWCGWCHKFDQTLAQNRALADAFYAQFVILKVSVDDDNDNAAFIAGLPTFSGYPHFFVADAASIFHSQSPTDFVVDGQFAPERIEAFIAQMQQHRPASTTQPPQ